MAAAFLAAAESAAQILRDRQPENSVPVKSESRELNAGFDPAFNSERDFWKWAHFQEKYEQNDKIEEWSKDFYDEFEYYQKLYKSGIEKNENWWFGKWIVRGTSKIKFNANMRQSIFNADSVGPTPTNICVILFVTLKNLKRF